MLFASSAGTGVTPFDPASCAQAHFPTRKTLNTHAELQFKKAYTPTNIKTDPTQELMCFWFDTSGNVNMIQSSSKELG